MFRSHRRERRHGERRHAEHQHLTADTLCDYPDCADCPTGAFPLSMAPCNQCMRLVGIEGGHKIRKRLAELGLNPGCMLRVVQRHSGGPMILAVKEDTRMAIGRGMAHKILVTAEAGDLI